MPVFTENIDVRANFYADTITARAGTFSDTWLNTSDRVIASNLTHQFPIRHSQKNGTAVVAESMPIFRAVANCVINSFGVFNTAKPTGGDLTFTVDLQKSTGGGAFASILTGVITRSSADANLEFEAGTLSSTTLVAGDALLVVIAVAGSTGTQGQGILCEAIIEQQGA